MKMRPLLISCALLLGMASAGHAAVTAYIYQNGTDVKVTGSGSINMTGLSSSSNFSPTPGIIPNDRYLMSTSTGLAETVGLYGPMTGPVSTFGTLNTNIGASSSSGTTFGVSATRVLLTSGYVSGSPINFDMTFSGQTLAGMTLIAGDYTYTLPNDSVTIKVGVAPPATPVPVISGWWLLPGMLAGLGFLARRSKV